MVLGEFPVPGRPTNLYYSRARADCACSKCGFGLFEHFFLSSIFSLLSTSPWETGRYRLKYLSQRVIKAKTTIQPVSEIICKVLVTFLYVGLCYVSFKVIRNTYLYLFLNRRIFV